jgi:diguanylate cyclase (GGDEF)-like protein
LAKHLASDAEHNSTGKAGESNSSSRLAGAEKRAAQASGRDDTASHRDVSADARDAAAEVRDKESARIERQMASRGASLRSALTHAAELRAQAARDRARAAEDRVHAAEDREWAADVRREILSELRLANRDELTGAYRRRSGELALQGEIDRARREDSELVLAFVDVDALREINNREGHPAGDELLRSVVSAIRLNIRSYEPVVRFGGDEFVCTMAGVDIEQAEERFRAVQDVLALNNGGTGVSVGLAELQDDDTLAELIERADVAMLDGRRARSATG